MLAIWLKWRPSRSKPVISKFTSVPASLRCKSNSRADTSTTHILQYRAYAQLHAEAYPEALSTHKSPHTVTVHGISRVASRDSFNCLPGSIASNIYPSSGIEGTIKASTRLWPPELECMAQVKTLLWQHSRTAADKAAVFFTFIYISLIVEISFWCWRLSEHLVLSNSGMCVGSQL